MQLKELILIDLTRRAYKDGKRIDSLVTGHYCFQPHYLPWYFSFNFPEVPIDALNRECLDLQEQGLIEFCPTAYILLRQLGVDYCISETLYALNEGDDLMSE